MTRTVNKTYIYFIFLVDFDSFVRFTCKKSRTALIEDHCKYASLRINRSRLYWGLDALEIVSSSPVPQEHCTIVTCQKVWISLKICTTDTPTPVTTPIRNLNVFLIKTARLTSWYQHSILINSQSVYYWTVPGQILDEITIWEFPLLDVIRRCRCHCVSD